tara:strand:- start:19 stop:735 length:717 start_codon:yes stop_codon:yes gene_type:complete
MAVGAYGSMLIVLQGRLNSNRLQYKGLFNFFNQTVFERIIDIAKNIRFKKKIIFATSTNKNHEILKKICEDKKILFYQHPGDEENVFKRFETIIKKNKKFKYVLRITCDNYLIQPEIIEYLYKKVIAEKTDYGYIETLSHFSGEIIKSSILLEEGKKKISNKAKEHVTWDIRNSNRYKKTILPKNLFDIDHQKSPSLDTLDDLIKLNSYQYKYPKLAKIRNLSQIKKIFPYKIKLNEK